MGAIAYLILGKDAAGNPANLLIDTPPWDTDTENCLRQQGGIRWWIFTHRGGIGRVKPIQAVLESEILIQEQEAYLLPEVPGRVSYRDQHAVGSQATLLWTPGYSPGSACLYYPAHGGVLFSGRHLLPNQAGQLTPLRFAKTFHWQRQLRQVQRLVDEFSQETLAYVCPAANIGFLRGERAIAQAYAKLQALDLEQLQKAAPGL